MAAHLNQQFQVPDTAVHRHLRFMSRVCYNMFRVLLLQQYDITQDDFYQYLSRQAGIVGENLSPYNVIERATANMFIQYFNSYVTQGSLEGKLSRTYSRANVVDGNYITETCWVYYLSITPEVKSTMGVPAIHDFLSALNNMSNQGTFETIFLLTPKRFNPDATAKIIDRKEIDLREMNRMLYDVSGHILQPHITILTELEAFELAASSGLTWDRLPRISEADPLMRDYGAKSGDVIHVFGVSGIQEELSDAHISYMAVIDEFAKKK